MKSQILLIVGIVSVILISGCIQNQTPPAPASPMIAELKVSDFLEDNTAEVTLTILKNVGYPEEWFVANGLQAEIILSEGLELIEGNPSWQGDLVGDESAEISIKVKAVKNGEWVIEGKTNEITMLPYENLSASDRIYILIMNGNIQISDESFTPVSPRSRAETV